MPIGIYERKKSAWNKGIHPSEETRRRQSESHKGKIISEETKLKLSKIAKEKGFGLWMEGKHHSEETKRKMSIITKNNCWMRGKHHSEETLNKISKAHLGNKIMLGKHRLEETKQKISLANKGRTLSKETRQKMSESRRGEKSHLWQGGKSFELYTIRFNKELKELIRNRDNYQCQICGMPECENVVKLSIHHIDYDKKNCLPSNLISLCIKCHSKTNKDRQYWIEYFLKEEKNGRNKVVWG